MTKDEFTERLQSIGTEENATQRLGLIAQLIEDGGKDYDDHASAIAARDQLLKDNGDLQALNKQLFSQVGVKKEPDVNPNPEPPKKRNFSDLFNEKGDLK